MRRKGVVFSKMFVLRSMGNELVLLMTSGPFYDGLTTIKVYSVLVFVFQKFCKYSIFRNITTYKS